MPDRSVDAVTCAQAWHWIDPVKGCREAARVLGDAGVLGLIWNVRDDSHDWVAQLTTVIGAERGERMALEGQPVISAPFVHAGNRQFGWVNHVTPDDLLTLVASRSSVVSAPEHVRASMLGDVSELLATHPDTAGRHVLDLPYITTAWRITR